jgi:hypothetical protein
MLVAQRSVQPVIRMIRGQRVILSPDLAAVYGVETRVLNQAVRRNRDRFPADFGQLSARLAELERHVGRHDGEI